MMEYNTFCKEWTKEHMFLLFLKKHKEMLSIESLPLAHFHSSRDVYTKEGVIRTKRIVVQQVPSRVFSFLPGETTFFIMKGLTS